MPAPSSLQLIDEEKQFSTNVNSYFASVDLLRNGLNYHVVSVFGSQSTGKSTLLNALFGTRFDVMEDTRRRQTTKGIWMARAASTTLGADLDADDEHHRKDDNDNDNDGADSAASSDSFVDVAPPSRQNVVVLDVEGTDGRERGEDQDFERKAALFALATSEVLIVNMWENQVGLYQGANMGLLRTVFEVNLALFQNAGQRPARSLILFVIRDHLGHTPLANLAATLREDLAKHWASIAKPTEALQDSRIEDFFDVEFVALPHKLLMAEQFAAQTKDLGRRFTDPSLGVQPDTGYVFRKEYHRNVPVDGWSVYAEQVWAQIEANKDLDLPTQQILVARFRCEEIAAQAFADFDAALSALRPAGAAGPAFGGSRVVDGFGAALKPLRERALHEYDAQASRYNAREYREKRAALRDRIDGRVKVLHKAQLVALHKDALAVFEKAVEAGAGPDGAAMSFGERLDAGRAAALMRFNDAATEASSLDPEVYSHGAEAEELAAALDDAVDGKRAAEISRLVARATKKISRTIASNLDTFFAPPTPDTWQRVRDFVDETVTSTLRPYSGGADFGVGASEAENAKGQFAIRQAAWSALDAKLGDITRDDNVLLRLREAFEETFRYDKNKVPIVWKATDDIEGPYVEAREATLKLLPIFATARLPSGDLLVPDVPLPDSDDVDEADATSEFAQRIPDGRVNDLAARFRQQAAAMFVDAKRSAASSATHVPFFIYVVIAVLGWNEFMAVLRNPLLILFVLLLAGGGYVTYTLNMWGPLLSVSQAMYVRALDIAKEKLREALEVPPGAQTGGAIAVPGAVPSPAPESIPLEDLKPAKTSDPDTEPS